jgi:putative zinc finger protein
MSTAAPHAWLRRVSDYHSGGVSERERAAVEAHLAECAECRLALTAYRRLYTLARSPLRLGDGGAGALAEYRPMILEETMVTTDRETTRGAPPRPPRRTALTALGAIAAVLVIAILAATLFAHFRAPTQPVTPRPTATPALDSASQAYIDLLHTYYLPMANANDAVSSCFDTVYSSHSLQDLAACRSPVTNELATAQTLRSQLATATPPTRWQTQHVALQQAVQSAIAFLTEELAAIDTQDLTRYLNTQSLAYAAFGTFCEPIAQLNAGPPPLTPLLRRPDATICYLNGFP